MIHFFVSLNYKVFAVQTHAEISLDDIKKLNWLFGESQKSVDLVQLGYYVGPRAAMITPWSTNAVEITQNMGISGIIRIEEFEKVTADFNAFDPMLSQKYTELNQEIYTIHIEPEPILHISDIAAYINQKG